MSGLNLAMTAANGVAAASALIFVVWYATRPWYGNGNKVGRALMGKAVAILALCTASLILRLDYYLDGRFSWETPIKVSVTIGFLGVAASYAYWIILLSRGDDDDH